MARINKIKLHIGGNDTILEVGDVCAEDFKNIERPKASVKSCQACLNAILDALGGAKEESDDSGASV